ncbi:MAG: response regulator [Bacteroidota bacterium]
MAKNIFIVDDDKFFGQMLKEHITKKGGRNVTIFMTGEDCLNNLDETPNLVILDYNLDTEKRDAANGLVILQAIRKKNQLLPVVMLSNQEQYSIALQTIQKGAEQYVIKDEDAFENIDRILEDLL